MEKLHVYLFAPIKRYMSELVSQEDAKIMADIYGLQTGDLDGIYTK